MLIVIEIFYIQLYTTVLSGWINKLLLLIVDLSVLMGLIKLATRPASFSHLDAANDFVSIVTYCAFTCLGVHCN
jgi:hypothetical protein